MVKTCAPDPVLVGNDICWNIAVYNTGDRPFDCTITDPTVPGWDPIDLPGTVPTGGSQSLVEVCREVLIGEAGSTISNTATAVCTPSNTDYDNVFDVCDHPLADCSADCEVPPEVDELCRTPGFWKTHAGVEKAGRSTNLTQTVIDYSDVMFGAGDGTFGLGTICGVDIIDTTTYNYVGTGIGSSNGAMSAVEGMCVHPKQESVRQLQRQLIAASINCVASGGGADCTGMQVEQVWKDANVDCAANAPGLTSWIDMIDDFNNGRAPYTCSENIKESVVFEEIIAAGGKVPGPAGSSNACSEATYNERYLVPVLTP